MLKIVVMRKGLRRDRTSSMPGWSSSRHASANQSPSADKSPSAEYPSGSSTGLGSRARRVRQSTSVPNT
jgi:hypothetical protein